MYIRRATVENVRSIRQVAWSVAKGEEAGWHVLLGENGSGKTAFLRAIALALLGPKNAAGLREGWDKWVRTGEQQGRISLSVGWQDRSDEDGVQLRIKGGRLEPARNGSGMTPASKHAIWRLGGNKNHFSASYGPFRRFSGGDGEFTRISENQPQLAAHLSLFGENFALTEAIRWLIDLHHRKLDQKPEGRLLDDLQRFVNESALLPHGTVIHEVSSDGVVFRDGNGCRVSVQELSDGYRSILSLTFELIRQLARACGEDRVFSAGNPIQVPVSGIVLIDEVDAHLHPTWQHRIGSWFTQVFPRMQFIVATHSPIACQAASSIWLLPSPGSEEPARRLEGLEFDRLRYGSILDAYGTGVFGEGVTRSGEGKKRLARLAELNVRELQLALTPDEERERETLRRSTPTAASVLPQTVLEALK